MIYPVIESITVVIISGLEVLKGKLAVKVAQYNNEITKMDLEDSPPGRAIGFSIPTEEDDYEEDD